MIVINTRGEIPDGTPVEVVRIKGRRPKASRPKAQKPSRKRETPLGELPALGMWKNRADWKGKSTLEIARELRQKALGGRRRG
jgi:hypothetical protein